MTEPPGALVLVHFRAAWCAGIMRIHIGRRRRRLDDVQKNPKGVADLSEMRASPCRTDPETTAYRAQLAVRGGWKRVRGICRASARLRQANDFEGDARSGGMWCTTGCAAPAGCVDGGRLDVRHLTSRFLRVWGQAATTQDGPEHRGEETPPGRNGRTTRSYGTRKPHEWRRSRRPSGDRGASRRGG